MTTFPARHTSLRQYGESGSSEISGNPLPRLTRNRQVVERCEVIGHLEPLLVEF